MSCTLHNTGVCVLQAAGYSVAGRVEGAHAMACWEGWSNTHVRHASHSGTFARASSPEWALPDKSIRSGICQVLAFFRALWPFALVARFGRFLCKLLGSLAFWRPTIFGSML